MTRYFSTSAALALKRFIGYPIEKLDPAWQKAVGVYKEVGAPKKVDQEVDEIQILYPEDGSSPVHTSQYNPKDPREILSAKIKLRDGTLAPGTHHIFIDGKGTSDINDKPE